MVKNFNILSFLPEKGINNNVISTSVDLKESCVDNKKNCYFYKLINVYFRKWLIYERIRKKKKELKIKYLNFIHERIFLNKKRFSFNNWKRLYLSKSISICYNEMTILKR